MERTEHPFPFNHMIPCIKGDKHLSFILYGPRGAGKSRTALYLSYNLAYYQENKRLPETYEDHAHLDIWEKIIKKRVIFTPKQLIDKLKKDKRYSFLIIDDANIMFHTGIFRNDPHLYYALIGLLATIRTKIGNLIVTAVDPTLLIKPLRQMYTFNGYVTSNSKYTKVKVYSLTPTPVQVVIKKKGIFQWANELLPREAYEIYRDLRERIGKFAINVADRVIHREEETNDLEGSVYGILWGMAKELESGGGVKKVGVKYDNITKKVIAERLNIKPSLVDKIILKLLEKGKISMTGRFIILYKQL
jgi:hypothetical protein